MLWSSRDAESAIGSFANGARGRSVTHLVGRFVASARSTPSSREKKNHTDDSAVTVRQGKIMNLEEAQIFARQAMDFLKPHCQRIEIAGSIRRQKQDRIKDVELVAISKRVAVTGRLFATGETVATLSGYIATQTDELGPLDWNDEHGRKNGDRQKALLWHRKPVDLFICTRETWGAMLAIRTGPADFSTLLVTSDLRGGAMPEHLRQDSGRLWHGGEPLETPSEAEWFKALGVPCWPAEQRTVERLKQHLRERTHSHAGTQS